MQKLLLVFFIAFTELKSLLKKHLLTFILLFVGLIFKDLHTQGRTVIIVTHNHDIAGQCNKAVLLKDGLTVSL